METESLLLLWGFVSVLGLPYIPRVLLYLPFLASFHNLLQAHIWRQAWNKTYKYCKTSNSSAAVLCNISYPQAQNVLDLTEKPWTAFRWHDAFLRATKGNITCKYVVLYCRIYTVCIIYNLHALNGWLSSLSVNIINAASQNHLHSTPRENFGGSMNLLSSVLLSASLSK